MRGSEAEKASRKMHHREAREEVEDYIHRANRVFQARIAFGASIGCVKVREVMRLLESNGWRLKATKGSHRQFKHPAKGLVVTVPGNLGKDVPLGTLKAILRSAGLDSRGENR